jgi:ERCC4-type nuclease
LPFAIPAPLTTVIETLDVGDYSVRGLTDQVAVERKSLGDLVSCVGCERERFERELVKLRGFPCSLLVIESNWAAIELGSWRGRVTPTQVVGSLLGWAAWGINVLMADNHERAGKLVARYLYTCARRQYRTCRQLLAGMEHAEPEAVGTMT